jgi:GNAT superfamily N-acetyltransferase
MNRFRIERLAKQDRSTFDCGNDALNGYLRRIASQDQKRRYAVCFLAIENESQKIAGFYTLSSASVALEQLPEDLVKSLPRYPVVPVVKLGRLAIDESFRGLGLSRAMLADVYQRVRAMEIGAHAVAVDAKDDEAEAFYLHHGFVKLKSAMPEERLLFLPINDAD